MQTNILIKYPKTVICFCQRSLYFDYNITHKLFNLKKITSIWDNFDLKLSKFFNDLYLAYDTYINIVIYSSTRYVINNDTWMIDGEFYDLKEFKKIYETYILRNFIKDVTKL